MAWLPVGQVSMDDFDDTTDPREAAVHFEAVKTSMSQSKSGTILRLAIHPNEVPPSLHADWVGSRYMVAMVKLNDQDEPEISLEQQEINRLIASAGALCRNSEFAQFLYEQDLLALGFSPDERKREAAVADALRQHLGIESRADMKNDTRAREMFKQLSEEFVRWKKGHQPKPMTS